MISDSALRWQELFGYNIVNINCDCHSEGNFSVFRTGYVYDLKFARIITTHFTTETLCLFGKPNKTGCARALLMESGSE